MTFLFGLGDEVVQAFPSDIQGNDGLCIIDNKLASPVSPGLVRICCSESHPIWTSLIGALETLIDRYDLI